MALKNRRVLLGVTGSIAAYKSLDLARRLIDSGASVRVVMTDAALRFVTPLSFETITGNRVHSDLFDDPLCHITLTADADVLVVAPATANSIAKFRHGIADDLLSTIFLSQKAPVVLAPAMNWRMYENPVVIGNLGSLVSRGAIQVGPEEGSLACGEEGKGRMASVEEIVEAIRAALSVKDLSGRHVVVTAGPTREYLDPVRFLSNRSSGRMGFAIARAALRRGAGVTLISGPVQLTPPSTAHAVRVETASEMRSAVLGALVGCDVLVMAAAVSDFSPAERAPGKIEKGSLASLALAKTPDILAEVGAMAERPLLVGFSAETGDNTERAERKRTGKNADLMVFNDVSAPGSGFDVDTNEITLLGKAGAERLPLLSKDEAADRILDRVAELLKIIP